MDKHLIIKVGNYSHRMLMEMVEGNIIKQVHLKLLLTFILFINHLHSSSQSLVMKGKKIPILSTLKSPKFSFQIIHNLPNKRKIRGLNQPIQHSRNSQTLRCCKERRSRKSFTIKLKITKKRELL